MLFIFDLGGVLIHNNDLLPAISRELGADPAELLRRLREPFDAMCSGRLSAERFWDAANAAYGTDVREDLWETWYRPTVDLCVEELIEELRSAGHRVVAGSNTMDAHYRHHLERGHLRAFDRIYASQLMGCVKPDPAFYRYILEREGVPAHGAFFIDDRQENVRAARDLGIEAVRFTGCDDLRRELDARSAPGSRSASRP